MASLKWLWGTVSQAVIFEVNAKSFSLGRFKVLRARVLWIHLLRVQPVPQGCDGSLFAPVLSNYGWNPKTLSWKNVIIQILFLDLQKKKKKDNQCLTKVFLLLLFHHLCVFFFLDIKVIILKRRNWFCVQTEVTHSSILQTFDLYQQSVFLGHRDFFVLVS